jgi:hypothetical protein
MDSILSKSELYKNRKTIRVEFLNFKHIQYNVTVLTSPIHIKCIVTLKWDCPFNNIDDK